MTDADGARGCGIWALAVGVVLGFVAVLAVLLLRAPGDDGGLAATIAPPPGYVLLDDARSGGGRVSASRAASHLGLPGVPGFRDAALRAWGRRAGEPERAVVVLAVRLGTPEEATAVRDAWAAAERRAGATPFATAAGPGFREPPDTAGRHAQRVGVTRGDRLYVVAVLTPAAESDTSEVVSLATAQA